MGTRLQLLGLLPLLLGALACGSRTWGSSSFTQHFPGGSFTRTVSRLDLAADILAVKFELSDPSLRPSDFDYRFLIFLDTDSNGVYEPGVDRTIARSKAMVFGKSGGQVPDAHFEWQQNDHDIGLVFIFTMPDGNTLFSYETLAN